MKLVINRDIVPANPDLEHRLTVTQTNPVCQNIQVSIYLCIKQTLLSSDMIRCPFTESCNVKCSQNTTASL